MQVVRHCESLAALLAAAKYLNLPVRAVVGLHGITTPNPAGRDACRYPSRPRKNISRFSLTSPTPSAEPRPNVNPFKRRPSRTAALPPIRFFAAFRRTTSF
jgi:hypothetical protein